MTVQSTGIRSLLIGMLVLLLAPMAASADQASRKSIDEKVNAALARLHQQIPGADAVLARARGVLVFADVIKAGFIVAGEGGKGALRINGRSTAYYSIYGGSVGFQAGGQKRDIILVFLDGRALKKFETSNGWKVGADATVTLVDVGKSGSIDSATLNKPIVGFVVGQKGLMAGISLDGSKISRLKE